MSNNRNFCKKNTFVSAAGFPLRNPNPIKYEYEHPLLFGNCFTFDNILVISHFQLQIKIYNTCILSKRFGWMISKICDNMLRKINLFIDTACCPLKRGIDMVPHDVNYFLFITLYLNISQLFCYLKPLCNVSSNLRMATLERFWITLIFLS